MHNFSRNLGEFHQKFINAAREVVWSLRPPGVGLPEDGAEVPRRAAVPAADASGKMYFVELVRTLLKHFQPHNILQQQMQSENFEEC